MAINCALEVYAMPTSTFHSTFDLNIICTIQFKIKYLLATFAFGLIHGFGFAAVLGDLGLKASGLIVPLLGFNLGVEIGQIAILSVFLPLSYSLRETWFYKHIIFYGGSVIIICIALTWFAERTFNLKLFSSILNF